jgi:hypothetical protein
MTASPSEARALTAAEEAVVGALDAACRQLGLDDGIPGPVLAAVEEELRARERGHGAHGSADLVSEREWSEIGAAAAVGVLFASGLPERKRRPRQNPASAGFEPLGLARLSSGALAGLFVRRWAGERLARFRRARSATNGPS